MVKGYFGIIKLKEAAPEDEVEFEDHRDLWIQKQTGNLGDTPLLSVLVIEASWNDYK
jgi:hypothetical protein